MSDKFRSRFESITFDNEEDRIAYDNEHLRKTANEIMDRHKQTFQKLREHEIKEKQLSAGTKFDNGKPPLSIIPREALEGCAKAFDYGSRKYDRNNFKKGIQLTRILDATLRHVTAYLDGENLDPESNLSHLDHALASLSMAKYMEVNRPEMDDRFIDPVKQRSKPDDTSG